MPEIFFEIKTPLDVWVRTTIEHWSYICTVKHPEIKELEEEVKNALLNPMLIKKSNSDEDVFLYYSKFKSYYLCVVARHSENNGFIITSYITDKIKKGNTIWIQ